MNFNNAKFEASYGNYNQLKKSDLPEVVFSGRSNVGKSSLINKLINRKALARTSSKPGKTGTVNFYDIKEIKLVDIPGYGYAKVSNTEKARWSELIQGYFNSKRNISLVIQILDIRHSPSKDDMIMINYLKELKFNFIIVLTKVDKLNKSERIQRMNEFTNNENLKDIKLIVFSAVTGEGTNKIKNHIIESI